MHKLLSSERLQNEISGEGTVYIEAYQNGREQGITVWDARHMNGINDVAYFVSEHRNSDSIVVYKGRYSMQSISEDAYKHSNSFGDPEEAAEWIIDELIK
jgi:hypothetical protein